MVCQALRERAPVSASVEREPGSEGASAWRKKREIFMCGIVGYVGKKRVVPVIIDGLRRLEYRGYDSAGLAVYCDDDQLAIRRAKGKLRNLPGVTAFT